MQCVLLQPPPQKHILEALIIKVILFYDWEFKWAFSGLLVIEFKVVRPLELSVQQKKGLVLLNLLFVIKIVFKMFHGC